MHIFSSSPAKWTIILVVLARLTTSAFAAGEEDRTIRVEWNRSQKPGRITVRGLPPKQIATLARLSLNDAKYQQLLAVYVGKTGPADQPAMLGKLVVNKTALSFIPRYNLRGGTTYRAVFRPRVVAAFKSVKPARLVFRVPMPNTQPTRVTAVYPSATAIPENQLRFYLHFSAPMSAGEVYQHIRLLKQDGTPVFVPFLEIEQELWDPAQRRLTLLCDPGRVKRGLKPREEDGPIFEEGKKFTLVVRRSWRDANGKPLSREFRKSFKVGPPDDKQPNPAKWKLRSPLANTQLPLRIMFAEPLDHGMLQRVLVVVDEQGKPIDGEASVRDREKEWNFTPVKTWRRGKYAVQVDTNLEDRAGNSIERPFEVDMFRKIRRRSTRKTIKLPFEIK